MALQIHFFDLSELGFSESEINFKVDNERKSNGRRIAFSKIAELKCGMYLGKKRAYEP